MNPPAHANLFDLIASSDSIASIVRRGRLSYASLSKDEALHQRDRKLEHLYIPNIHTHRGRVRTVPPYTPLFLVGSQSFQKPLSRCGAVSVSGPYHGTIALS